MYGKRGESNNKIFHQKFDFPNMYESKTHDTTQNNLLIKNFRNLTLLGKQQLRKAGIHFLPETSQENLHTLNENRGGVLPDMVYIGMLGPKG